MKKIYLFLICFILIFLTSCEIIGLESNELEDDEELIISSDKSLDLEKYVDEFNDVAYIPKNFKISSLEDERIIKNGLVIIAPDESEYVWVPAKEESFKRVDFNSFFSSSDSFSRYSDEVDLTSYKNMYSSVLKYGGFYIGRYEASKGDDNIPLSKKVTQDSGLNIWVRFAPQDTQKVCENLYKDNETVNGFFLWGINWDTTLQWLIDSNNKTLNEVSKDSTNWGNYSNDDFSIGANGKYTGIYDEAKANNIYDLAGNNWEWTQERAGTSYVMRGGGYNLMGGSCLGSEYPAAVRDPLGGNDHHPNVCFRVGLYLI